MQKALDDLVRYYIVSETGYEKAEKENSPGVENQETFEDEYIKALYECLESKGIVRELQTFLRQRLVAVLQDKWPDLGHEDNTLSFNPIAVRLVQDFLCCHKLLYTLSVFTSEIDHNFSLKDPYGKMPFSEAESLLDQMEIKRKTSLSIKILKCYLEKEKFSLWECIIYVSSWSSESFVNLSDHKENVRSHRGKEKTFDSEEHLHDKKLHFRKDWDGKSKATDERQHASQRNLELEDRMRKLEQTFGNDSELQIQIAIEKYKKEDAIRIHDEIETRLKFEMLAKEKDLLQSYEEKVISMKKTLEREKTMWLLEKDRQEKELLDHKERIVILMNSLTQKHELIKDSFEKYKDECMIEDRESQQRERAYQLKEVELSCALHKLQEENQVLKKNHAMTKQSGRLLLEENKAPHSESFQKKNPNYDSIETSNNDTIAFMKYSLENQAEEIKQLRSALISNSGTPRQSDMEKNMTSTRHELNFSQTDRQKSNFRDTHLEEFIKESKKRCNEIELEAKDIEISLQQFRERNSEKHRPIINRSSMITPSGRLNLRPSVPKLSVPIELPFNTPDDTYFPALLEQMFPSSRDYSTTGHKYNKTFQRNHSIPNEFSSTINKTPDAQRFAVFGEDVNPVSNSNVLSKLQEHIQDFSQLVNAVNANAATARPPTSLNTIVENGEKLHENKTVFSISSQGQYNTHKSNPPTTDAKEQSINYESRPPEENNSRQAGGDAHVLVSSPGNASSAGSKLNLQGSNGEDYVNNAAMETKAKESPKDDDDIEVKASASGALRKAKVSSPKEAAAIDDNFEKSEASVSIRSVMKMQSNFETKLVRPNDNGNVISSKVISKTRNATDNTNYDNSPIGDVEDISISAPDTSQSLVEDFWNV